MNLAKILTEWLESSPLSGFGGSLASLVQQAVSTDAHGDLESWCHAIDDMHHAQASQIDLCADVVTIGQSGDIDAHESQQLQEQLQLLHPWRKGPFSLFGVDIDTEWRSNLKWRRLENEIEPLNGRQVLDVGCGNGYYLWRMRGSGASQVVGIDPELRFLMQFMAIRRYLPGEPVWIFPLKDE